MVFLLWDASALSKRYAPEIGSDTVDALYAAVPPSRMASSSVSYAEIYSILLRKFNRAAIDHAAFHAAKSSLRADLINDPDFVLLSIDDTAFYSGIALMETHNLNATDAALMTLFQSYKGRTALCVRYAKPAPRQPVFRKEGVQWPTPILLSRGWPDSSA